MRAVTLWCVCLLSLLCLVPAASAQEESVRPGINQRYESPDLNVAEWVERFESEGREIFDKREAIADVCGIQQGMGVADVGAGTGLFTRLFAEQTGAAGHVYAVDISPKFVERIKKTCGEAGLGHVTGIVCAADDSKLPAGSVDVVFICDTYHHFEFPFKTMASIHRALRPGGRLVVIDFKRIEGQSSDWIIQHVRAGQDVVTKEIESSGFEFVDAKNLLKDNYVLRFKKLGARETSEGTSWKPIAGQLMTRWADDVSPDNVWAEYPRPQMVRKEWVNLNGLWDYAIEEKDASRPEKFEGKILVPFAAESALSGVKKPVGDTNRLWYRREFNVPKSAQGKRLLLHFGGVDWHSVIWVNGKQVGEHRGGYDAFSIDITDAVTQNGKQELVVSVWDPTNKGYQPRGKQVTEPRGIWYTSVTGIWQTVWLETVPPAYVRALKLTPDLDGGKLHVTADIAGSSDGLTVIAEASGGGLRVSKEAPAGAELELEIKDARVWSPDDPFLYDLNVQLRRSDEMVDRVDSYFGMRKIEVSKDDDGFNRLFLNNKPLFQFGPLDQGWWPDGLYTAPTDSALRYDLEVTKQLGFNMIRKHVKVEPGRWYYHCDQLGILVWQDMPNGDRHIGRDDPDLERSRESTENFRREFRAMIDTHRNHPCIVAWVPFNEGWGQFATNRVLGWTKEYDPTRLVDTPSGWTDRGGGDMNDIHRYPGPDMPEPEENRAIVLGEFGGLGLPVQGHLWWDKRNWGYRTYKTREELRQNYESLIRKLRPLIGAGLAAAVYTQTTDVEGEVNGLMTYDRAMVKYDAKRLAALHEKLYLPPPIVTRTTVLPTSEKEGRPWRYALQEPTAGWQGVDYDDSAWQQAQGGFGSEGTPGAIVRTEWETNQIWLRRSFEWTPSTVHSLYLRIHHDEDAEVYLNGRKVATLTGYTTRYEELELDEDSARLLRHGKNTLAVHCRQTTGGQYIDVGLADVEEKPR